MFGTDDWYDAFYETYQQRDMFDELSVTKKVATFDKISKYFVARLKTAFPGVADNSLPLMSSKGNPLFLLCFAAANKRGAITAIRIAQNILEK